MGFETALVHLKTGAKVVRKGWNGKGLFVRMAHPALGGDVNQRYFVITDTNREVRNTWVPSVSDLLAEDWELVE